MKNKGFLLCLLVILPTTSLAVRSSQYTPDYRIWQVTFTIAPGKNIEESLRQMEVDGKIDIFEITRNKIVFRVFSEFLEDVTRFLQSFELILGVKIQDLSHILKKEEVRQRKLLHKSCTSSSCDELPTDFYMTFDEISAYLSSVATNNPSLVKLNSIGQTFEGRDIWMITINSEIGSSNKSIFVEGGIHAREWISPSVTLHIIDMLVKTPNLAEGIEFRIVPVANPDGYVYSHTSNRFWRKNRSPNPNTRCIGTDLNRNWDFKWGLTGTSSNPCSEIYKGSSPFSELETKALRDAMLSAKNVKLVLAIHSYGQLMLYPWGYTLLSAPNSWELCTVAVQFGLRVFMENLVTYRSMPGSFLYRTSGTTDDWAYGALGAKYAYTLELRDNGIFGFLLPPQQIEPTRKEIWKGFQYLVERVKMS